MPIEKLHSKIPNREFKETYERILKSCPPVHILFWLEFFSFTFCTEVLGALISVMIIWITTGILVYLAVHRVIKKEYEINADDMLITAGLGVAFNIV